MEGQCHKLIGWWLVMSARCACMGSSEPACIQDSVAVSDSDYIVNSCVHLLKLG